MGLKILHNPRCSKSRQTLAILSDNGIDVDIIEYLKDVPSEKTLRQIIDILGIKPRELLRKGEVVYKENNLRREDLTDDDLIQFMLDNPILIERPIVYDDKRAVIGRPPDNVLKLIKWLRKIKNKKKEKIIKKIIDRLLSRLVLILF